MTENPNNKTNWSFVLKCIAATTTGLLATALILGLAAASIGLIGFATIGTPLMFIAPIALGIIAITCIGACMFGRNNPPVVSTNRFGYFNSHRHGFPSVSQSVNPSVAVVTGPNYPHSQGYGSTLNPYVNPINNANPYAPQGPSAMVTSNVQHHGFAPRR